jgi:hypothetical protein
LIPPFHEFVSVLAVERENKLFIGPKQILSPFWANESLFSFSTAPTEKNS